MWGGGRAPGELARAMEKLLQLGNFKVNFTSNRAIIKVGCTWDRVRVRVRVIMMS